MKLKFYLDAIKEAGISNQNSAQTLLTLFRAGGYISDKEGGISESAARKWIEGKRNCKVSSYFPDDKFNNPKGIYDLKKDWMIS